jgi:hypothetical protein
MDLCSMIEYLKENYEFATALAVLISTVIAFLAFVLSVVSVCFTWRSVRGQQKHNALSVRPLPYITVGDYEDVLYVKIRNNGTGPLIIKSLNINGAQNPGANIVEAMPPLEDGVAWSHFSGSLEGRSIPAGGELTLIELKGNSRGDAFAKSRTAVRRALGSLSLKLDFTDVYNTVFPVSAKDLKWFHRTLSSE